MKNTQIFLTFIISVLLSFSAIGKTYYLEGDSRLGSRFKTRIASGPVPFDKRYQDMSVKQQAIIRSNYENMPVDETPPFPRHGLQSIYRPLIKYQNLAQRLRRGDLIAIALIDEKGMAKEVEVYAAPDKEIAQFLATLLLEIAYDPGICSGKPCQTEYLIDVGLDIKF
ncbi:hypothetical protein [Sessilibacter corallicola]|uniref:TonB C-terminal domain-containing protein n=1 Tax=Sessilibacter corallicola TaxID=2904075 RepID=A0ABQ0A4T1_9GAMM